MKIGIDVVDPQRLRDVIERSADVETHLFTQVERDYCRRAANPWIHLAGTLAAKEATMKALGLFPLHVWGPRIVVNHGAGGEPWVDISGHRGSVSISITHDGPVAVAVAIADPAPEPSCRLTKLGPWLEKIDPASYAL